MPTDTATLKIYIQTYIVLPWNWNLSIFTKPHYKRAHLDPYCRVGQASSRPSWCQAIRSIQTSLPLRPRHPISPIHLEGSVLFCLYWGDTHHQHSGHLSSSNRGTQRGLASRLFTPHLWVAATRRPHYHIFHPLLNDETRKAQVHSTKLRFPSLVTGAIFCSHKSSPTAMMLPCRDKASVTAAPNNHRNGRQGRKGRAAPT